MHYDEKKIHNAVVLDIKTKKVIMCFTRIFTENKTEKKKFDEKNVT